MLHSFAALIEEELIYEVKMFGIVVGEQRTVASKMDDKIVKLISETKTTEFFSKFYRLDNYLETLLHIDFFLPYFVLKNINEGSYHRRFITELDQVQLQATITTVDISRKPDKLLDQSSFTISHSTFDLLSLIYYIRHKELKIGESIEMPFLIEKTKTVEEIKIKVLKEELIKTKLGSFKTLKLKVKKGSKVDITIWLRLNNTKLPVKVKIKLRYGTLTAYLKEIKNLTFK